MWAVVSSGDGGTWVGVFESELDAIRCCRDLVLEAQRWDDKERVSQLEAADTKETIEPLLWDYFNEDEDWDLAAVEVDDMR